MKKNIKIGCWVLLFFFSVISSNSFAETTTGTKKFTLTVKDKLINLHADNVNFKDILQELGEKTGIKIEIFKGVENKKVSLDVKSLPIHDVHIILEKMAVKNSAIVYDKQKNSEVIYILPVGQNLSDVIGDKTILFASQKNNDIPTLDNPATFRLAKEMRKKQQAVVDELDMFPLPKFKDLTKSISLTEKEIDEILKSKAKTLDVPPELKKQIAAIPVVQNESPYNVGDWILMQDGSATYILKIKLEGVNRISAQFELNQVYKDAFVLAYSMKDNDVVEIKGPIPFTPRGDSSLVIPSLMSDEVFIEIRNLPAKLINQSKQIPFQIKDVQYYAPDLYKYLVDENTNNLNQPNETIAEKIDESKEVLDETSSDINEKFIKEAASCSYTDVNCVPVVEEIKNGVVKLHVSSGGGGIYNCTGFIIKDDESSTDIPYILTAGHCVEGSLEVREVFFRYESSSCEISSCYESTTLPADELDYENQSGCQHDADWALLRINDWGLAQDLVCDPVFLYAKTTQQPFGDKIYQIHHPDGDPKKFSKGDLSWNHTYTQEFDYDNGNYSEGGSSGSPIFDEDDLKVIGVFNCAAACSSIINAEMTKYSYIYNKIDEFLNPSLATPYITSVTYPNSSDLGDYFLVTIKVKNIDSYTSPYGHIHIAFPSYTSASDKDLVSVDSKSSDLVYNEYPAGYLGLNKRDGTQDSSANYLHIEAYDSNWSPNEENYLTLKVYPKAAGNMKIWYRANMKSENQFYYNTPSDSSYDVLDIDQQWPEKEIEIEIGGISLGEAIDNTSMAWTTGGNADWYGQAADFYYGGDSARSDDVTNNQASWIQTMVTGPGTLTFYWKVSSETNYDFLNFYIDDIRQTRISGTTSWQLKTFSISSGSHTLKWEYKKDYSMSSGSDAGWLDYVVFVEDVAPTLSYITISGAAQVNESSGAQYTCTAYYSDDSSSTVTNSATWSENSSYASINNSGYLTSSAVSSDQSCRITASYGGRSDTHDVTIKYVGCPTIDDQQAILDAYAAMETALEAEDIEGVMVYIASDYLDSGYDRASEQIALEGLFNQYNSIIFSFNVSNIVINGDTATCSELGSINTDRFSDEWNYTVYWVKENCEWKYSGNQLRYGKIDVETMYWEHGQYQLRLEVRSGPSMISSISISGPGYLDNGVVDGGGDPHFLYDDGQHHDGKANDGNWMSVVDISATPVVEDTFIFSITYSDNSIETVSRQVSYVFSETTALVSPNDGATVDSLTPTFTWQNLSIPVWRYSVQINDTNHNRLYEVYNLPDGTITHTIPEGYLNNSTSYYWLVSARDQDGNEALTSWDMFTTLTTEGYDISLTTGWDLISLPLQPSDTAIESVLTSISGKYASVWVFQNNAWKVYDPANPDFSDLLTMEAGWGYWIKMNEAATLSVSGSTPSDTIPLVSGWNLVGYNSTNSQAIADALASIDGKYISVWAFIDGGWKVYDPANPDFSDLLTMEPSYGYWINTTEACTWTLP